MQLQQRLLPLLQTVGRSAAAATAHLFEALREVVVVDAEAGEEELVLERSLGALRRGKEANWIIYQLC